MSYSPTILISNHTPSGSSQFQGVAGPQQDLLVHFIHAASTARAAATISSTKTKRISAWTSWNTFLLQVGITSTFLEGFTRFQQNILMSAFAQATREATFSKGNRAELVEGTVHATLSYVAQAFRSDNRPDP